MTLGLFDFHDHSSKKSSNLNSESEERLVKLCLNRFKVCRVDRSSHTYIFDAETEYRKEYFK